MGPWGGREGGEGGEVEREAEGEVRRRLRRGLTVTDLIAATTPGGVAKQNNRQGLQQQS